MLPPYHTPKGTISKVIFATRPVLEITLRRMLMVNYRNVVYHSGSVTGLVRSESSGTRLCAVRIKSRAGEEHNIAASLVVGLALKLTI